MPRTQIDTLLQSELRVINVGLQAFAEDLQRRGVEVVHIEWSPPAGGDAELAELLAKLGM